MTAARGIYLSRLTLRGRDVEDASVEFQDGLNVVAGPSDTGKTYILQCLDYVLGARRTPKDIPEAEEYSLAVLELRDRATGVLYSIERSLRGGGVRLSSDGGTARELSERHRDDENSLSYFLLSLFDAAGLKVRKNSRGETRSLSFRDLAHLAIITEEAIITESSPVLATDQPVSATAEKSVFRLLLTAVDDSDLVAEPDPRVARTTQAATEEVLGRLIVQARERLANLEVELSAEELTDEIGRIDEAYEAAEAEIDRNRAEVGRLETRRQDLASTALELATRVEVLNQLQERFKLLGEQYESDLSRLNAVAEAGIALSQLALERCPVCGAPGEYHAVEHRDLNPATVAAACEAEARKLSGLRSDIQTTIDSNESELALLRERLDDHRRELKVATASIDEELQPRLQRAVIDFRELGDTRSKYARALEIHQQLEDIAAASYPTESHPVVSRTSSTIVTSADAEEFCLYVESLLREWNFPDLGRVTFSESEQDLVISGTSRSSHGKGVRAITHAAFTIGLMDYCYHRETPHPLFVAIDSPLVVYREPDAAEVDREWKVKDAFYRALAAREQPGQVIIFENETPPADVTEGEYVTYFTGTSIGRRGFIP